MKHVLIVLSAITVGIAAALYGAASTDEETGLDLQSLPQVSLTDITAETDSLCDSVPSPQQIAAAALDKAIESYKRVKWEKFEGDSDADLYASVYQCYLDNLAAVDANRDIDPTAIDRCKGMLRDLDRDLERGAFYYSGQNDSSELAKFSQAYIDTQLLDIFKGETFPRDDASFPSVVYCAASGAYNDKDFERAIKYFSLYFSTGEEKLREQIYLFMGQACLNTGKYDLAVTTMNEGVRQYPANYNMIAIAIKACIDGGHAEYLQELLDKAFVFKPDDEQLLNIQGKLYEDEQEYNKALEIYNRLDMLKPNNLSVAKHIALCYYNLGVLYFNKAIMEEEEKSAKKFKRQSNNYFLASAEKLEEVVANDPMSAKYLKALAVTYGCMDNMVKFEEVNNRIQALGEQPMGAIHMPPIMAYNESNTMNYGRGSGVGAADIKEDAAPTYSEFAKGYIEERLSKWTRKNEFEKVEDYQLRVNDHTIRDEYDRLCRLAEDEYLEQYARKLRLNDLELKPYDAGNEVYLIESSYGPIYLNVPLKNNEAELFKSNWAGIHFRSPKYYIKDDKVLVSSITFVTPNGKSYTYNAADRLSYAHTKVNVDFESILADIDGSGAASRQGGKYTEVNITRKSDVDENIPVTGASAPTTVAVVIANENYTNVSDVQSALHDGEVFAQYCNLTLGLPQENIRLYKNATLGTMLRAVAEIRNTVNSLNGEAELIVFYAGHGMPDEGTKDAFLLPVDGDATMSASCYSLGKLYAELGELNAKSIMVFLDACFSGSQRDGGMLMAARGVAIKPKEAAPRGNMFTLTATSGQETALPYKEKNHGLFTYYLLKKIQESKGNITLKELSDDVIGNVKRQSNLINKKPQTPQVSTSGSMSGEWTHKKLRK